MLGVETAQGMAFRNIELRHFVDVDGQSLGVDPDLVYADWTSTSVMTQSI